MDPDEQKNEFFHIQPRVIRGYTSAIKTLAIKIKESGIQFRPPRVIFTTAENIDDLDREIISSVFRSEVVDYYCCNEIGIMAWECKKHIGYHINMDNVIIEFIKNGKMAKSGEESDIVVTGLNNYVMPFIRYKIGDTGIPKDVKCTCGNSSFLIGKIMGRENDRIFLSENKTISPYLLMSVIKNVPGVIKFQVIQKEMDRIVIKIVKDKFIAEGQISSFIKDGFQKIIGDAIKVELIVAGDITREESGKFRVVKNEMGNLWPPLYE